jgi:hypothetical protein
VVRRRNASIPAPVVSHVSLLLNLLLIGVGLLPPTTTG